MINAIQVCNSSTKKIICNSAVTWLQDELFLQLMYLNVNNITQNLCKKIKRKLPDLFLGYTYSSFAHTLSVKINRIDFGNEKRLTTQS